MPTKVNLTDIYWAAGFLDGEGCFSIKGGSPRIDANQKAITGELLVRLQSLFGGTLRNIITKDQVCWQVSGLRCIGLCMTLYPILSAKRQNKIKEIMKQWKSNPRPNNSIDPNYCNYGHLLNKETTRLYKTRAGREYRVCKQCQSNFHKKYYKEKNHGNVRKYIYITRKSY